MRFFLFSLLVGACLGTGVGAQEPKLEDFAPGAVINPDETPGARKLSGAEQALPPEQFLELARKPFLDTLWCRFVGTAEFKGSDGRKKAPLQLALRLGAAALRAELSLKDGQTAKVLQVYKPDGSLPDVKLELSTVTPEQLTLEKLGLQPDDLTFCFLYWTFIRELPGESVYMQKCRVLELEHPTTKARAQVWMLKECAFPMAVYWFRSGETDAWRCFKFAKSFKHHGDFTFPTEMRLSGLVEPTWEAKVTFKDAEIARPAEKMEPADLFSPAAAAPTVTAAPSVPAPAVAPASF